MATNTKTVYYQFTTTSITSEITYPEGDFTDATVYLNGYQLIYNDEYTVADSTITMVNPIQVGVRVTCVLTVPVQVGGSDSVKTINGISPDTNGNVTLNLITLTQVNSAIDTKLVPVIAKNTEQDGRLDTLEAARTSIESRLDTDEAEMDSISSRLDTDEGKLTELEGDVTSVDTRVTTLETTTGQHTTELADHETRITALENPTP